MVRSLINRRLAAVFALALTACSQTPEKPDQPVRDPSEIYTLAAAAYQEQDWTSAERYYLQLTRQVPSEFEPWFRLGNVYARTERLDRAIVCYREALVRDTRSVKAWHNMAVTQLRESGKSFLELEMLVNEDDPLHEKSVRIQRAIDELVN